MTGDPIRSLQNRIVVESTRLHRVRDRRRAGATLLEGPHLLEEALGAGVDIRHVFVAEDDPDGERWPHRRLVDQRVLAKLAGTAHPRGPVAVVSIPPWDPSPLERSVVVAWSVSDPGNAGTIIRSAAAFGLGVGIGPGTVDVWSPKVLRAASGAHFRTSLFPVVSAGDLEPWRTAALVVSGGRPPEDLVDGPWAVVVGSEAHGLPHDVVESCDAAITVPMPGGVESLNAAVSASIVAYALSRSSAEDGDH